jgi:hypothetical protein
MLKFQKELIDTQTAHLKKMNEHKEEFVADIERIKKTFAEELTKFKNELKGEIFQDLTDYVTAMLELKAEAPYDGNTDHNPALDLLVANELKRKQAELDSTMNNLTNYEFSDQE